MSQQTSPPPSSTSCCCYTGIHTLWKLTAAMLIVSRVSSGFQAGSGPHGWNAAAALCARTRRTGTRTHSVLWTSVSSDDTDKRSRQQRTPPPPPSVSQKVKEESKSNGRVSIPSSQYSHPKQQSAASTQQSSSPSPTSFTQHKQTHTNHVIPGSRRQATVQFNKHLHRMVRSGEWSAKKAEQALRDRIDKDDGFDNVSFNICLNAWAHERSKEAAQRADDLFRLLQTVHDNHHKHPVFYLRPDTYTYSAVMNAHAKSGQGREAALRTEQLLQQAKESIKMRSDVCYNAVMDAWSASRSPEAGDRADAILKQLEDHPDIQPTRWAYNAAIKAWAKTPSSSSNNRNNNAHRAQAILDRMQGLYESGANRQVAPDKYGFTTVIDAWAKSSAPDAANRAEALLQTMEQRYATLLGAPDNNNINNDRQRKEAIDVQPDVVTYTTVLAAYANSSKSRLDPHVASYKAMDLLQRMERYSNTKPNQFTYNALIHLFAKNEAPEQAEAIMRIMQEMYENGNKEVRPDKVTYTAVMSSYASLGTLQGAERAEALLDEMEISYNNSRSKDERFLPNAQTFASVLNAYAKSGAAVAQERADRLLQRMDDLYERTGKREDLKPNTIVFSHFFQILSNGNGSSDGDRCAAERAEKLLERMQHLYDEMGYKDMLPDATTYAFLINAHTKSGSPRAAERATEVLELVESRYEDGDMRFKPTSLLYSAVLQSYAKSASKDGAKSAEGLLERNKKLYHSDSIKYDYAKPSVLCYNAVVDAWARSGQDDAPRRAEELLDEMESLSSSDSNKYGSGDTDMKPTTRSYNAVLLAWKNSSAPNATDCAEAILKRMNERCKQGDARCKPDRVTINSIIGVWAKSRKKGSAQRAKSFLSFMEKMYQEAGDPTLKPDRYSFNSVIDAFARCNSTEAASSADELFERMQQLHNKGDVDMKPNLITYTSLKNAWSRSDPGSNIRARRLRELTSMQQNLFKSSNNSDAVSQVET